ncbi:FkbM family methyltransferase [Dysgonomonas sp. 520]|uniref:FkbM family methyltransferase n=1 Tax=Dysgonomonas sp. 520 TaxID=2302931 RepID=UPI0013D35F76|nr:FkbM family methyltransferase [Dysgonomonas sp. 520]NDW08522.1 FkbM family methyltransferase [Dysgonomonas sp. 520]
MQTKQKNFFTNSWDYVKMKLGAFSLWQLKRDILSYYKNVDKKTQDVKIAEALEYLRKHRLHVFPYPFAKKYKKEDVEVFIDQKCGLKYVVHNNGHRLYFRRGSKTKRIQRQYSFLCCEQDPKSAHCYLSDTFRLSDGDILFDVGAAEGNFSLSVIEKLKHAYLFECDEEWIEALQKTFEPWKEKVTIINKFVADKDSPETIKIDTVTENMKSGSLFLKLDVEGMEKEVLEGAKNTLNSENFDTKVALCTYHNQNDFEELSGSMKKKGYKIEPSDGYMLFAMEKLSPPYFRKGLIRCSK